MKFDRKQLLLYAVTDRTWTGRQSLSQQVECALRGGVTCVQLREKELEREALLREARVIQDLCRRYQVPLIINDDWELALELGADGVHVGQEDDAVSRIRAAAGPDFIIGATAKTVDQARAAQAAGADYLGVGAVFPSPTKPGALRITTQQLRMICGCVEIPAVAIGGISRENARELAGGGMFGLAVVSALFAAPDITAAAQTLREISRSLVEQ